jgi:hypothetical protein
MKHHDSYGTFRYPLHGGIQRISIYRESRTSNLPTLLQLQITNKKFDAKVKQFVVPTWMTLDGYSVLPIGRIPRYKLLLSDLARRLPADRLDEVNTCSLVSKNSDIL